MKIRSSIILSSIIVTLLALLTVLPTLAATPIYVRPGGNDTNCDGTVDVDYSIGLTACAVQTIPQGISLVDPGGTVYVRSGTYVLSAVVDVNKAGITLDGDGAGATIVQVSGTGDRFNITAAGVTLQDFEIVKTDKTGTQEIIRIANGNNVTIKNNTIHGQFVIGDGEVSRAIVVNAGAFSGLNIEGNTIYALRQPAYISGSHVGTVQNNYVYGTKGWVLEGGNLTFTGNTWGTGAQANVYDIAIISAMPAAYYPDIVAMSNANNGAVIEDQRAIPTAVLSVVYVDAGTAYTTDLGGRYHPYSSITPAVARVVAGGTINVAAGTYDEDVNLNKSLSLLGAGAGSTTIRGVIGGDSATVHVSASNVTVVGFTITRLGNNITDWNNPGLNLTGIAVQGTSLTGMIVRDNTITGNRNGIDINNSSGHTIRNNVITNNRTGMILRNQTDNLAVIENEITNNWTMGILFLDASGGTNSPVQTALNCTFSNNNLSGNWYGQIVERQAGGSLPLPGTTNLKNFSGNWWGTATPVVSTANSTEPGYSAQIPVQYGGTAVAPGGQPDILGPASANFDFTPYLNSGTDTNVETTPGRGTNGFQGNFANVWVTAVGAQIGAIGRIQEGINAVPATTINLTAGTYTENVLVNKAVTLAGAGAGSTIVQPAVSNPVCAPGSLCGGAASNVFLIQANDVVIHDLTVDGDNPSLTSGIVRGGADLDARNGIIKNTNGTYNNLEVYNVTARNIYLRGIYSTGGSFNFHNNTVTNVQGEAASIAMFAWGGPGTMANNTVSYANDGLSANHSNGIQFLNNSVTHSGSGIHTDNSGDGGGVADLIQGNTVDCTGNPGAYGIWVFVPYLAPTVNNNTITNCDVGLSAWGSGAAVTTQFTNNTVTGNLATGGVGVYLTTSMVGYGYSDVSATFSGNTITGYETGVFLDANQQSWEPGPYVARTINAIFHLNQINGNTNGVDKGTTGTYVADFERNWWGAVSGPSGVGPGSGDSIVAGIDYQPWCNADFSNCSYYAPGTISMQTSGTPVEVGEFVTMDSLVTVDGVYGMQLRVNFDSTALEFQATSSHNDVAAAGWYWDQTVENFVAVSGGRRLSGTMWDPPHINPATLTGQSVATWRFRCLRPGTFNLTYDATVGTGTYLATKDGFGIPANLTGASVTCLAETASLNGYIKLQGRLGTNPAPAGWNDASVTLTCVSGDCTGFGPYTLTTDATGHYQLVKATPGSGIVLGTYSAVVSRRAYLGAAKATNVTIVAGTNTINIVSAAPTLLGGDVVAGSGINIGDLAALGGTFGNTVTPDTGNDVNGDGFVNIFDLVMAGGNFGQAASVWTP